MAKPIVREPALKNPTKSLSTKRSKKPASATSKEAANAPAEHSFTCTEQQKRAALKFVERTIEIQKIVGPVAPDPADGDDVLSQVNAGYRATVVAWLDKGRLVWERQYKGPTSTVILRDEDPGFILRLEDIMKNGELFGQAKAKDYLFAVNGRHSLAYEIVAAGKSRVTVKAYFGTAGREQELEWLHQLIDIRVEGQVTAFACPFCDENVPELYLSTDASECFGCVTCLTTLDEGEAERYQQTLKGGTA